VKAQVLEELPVSRLKSIAKFHSISLNGCLEKQDIVKALRSRGINDEEVGKERRAEIDKEKRAREASASPPAAPPSSKLPATAGKERTLKDNVARAWGYVIAANEKNKDNLLNWRPGRKMPKEDECLQEAFDEEMARPSGSPEPALGRSLSNPSGVVPPVRTFTAMKQPWKQSFTQPMKNLNTHPDVNNQTELCWHFARGKCDKGARCQWRHPAYPGATATGYY